MFDAAPNGSRGGVSHLHDSRICRTLLGPHQRWGGSIALTSCSPLFMAELYPYRTKPETHVSIFSIQAKIDFLYPFTRTQTFHLQYYSLDTARLSTTTRNTAKSQPSKVRLRNCENRAPAKFATAPAAPATKSCCPLGGQCPPNRGTLIT